MLAKNSGLEKARRAGRRAIVASVVMAAAATRTMIKIIRTARVIHLYICSSEILSKGTVTVIQKIARKIFPASMRRSSSAQNWRQICPTPGGS